MAEKQGSCDAFEILISEYVCDGPLELSETERTALEGHLASCDGCRKRHAAWGKAEGRLRQMFPLVRQLTAEDVPDEVAGRAWKGITDRINGHSGTRVLSVATKCHARERTNAKWAFWGSAAAALILLAAGFAAFWPSPRQRPDQSVAEAAIERVSAPKSVSQLRREFDELIQKNVARQINVNDFEKGVRGTIAECRTLLADNGLPEANAIHAQKLLADGHGALVEFDEELTAYVGFAEGLSRYYSTHPDEYTRRYRDLTVAQDVLFSALSDRAESLERSRHYLRAIRSYEVALDRLAKTHYEEDSIMGIVRCYTAYDQPDLAYRFLLASAKTCADRPGGLDFLRHAAQYFRREQKYPEAAEIWLRISDSEVDISAKSEAAVAAASLLVTAKKYPEARRILAKTIDQYPTFQYRNRAQQLLALSREKELHKLMGHEKFDPLNL